jgi:hypothetical protein
MRERNPEGAPAAQYPDASALAAATPQVYSGPELHPGKSLLAPSLIFDFVFVYWHLILVTPDGPRFRSTFLPRHPLAMVVLF